MGIIGLIIMGTLLYFAKKQEKAQFEAFAKEYELEKRERQQSQHVEQAVEKTIEALQQKGMEDFIESLSEFHAIKGKLEKKKAEMDVETKHAFERLVDERMPNMLESYLELSEENQRKEKAMLCTALQEMKEELTTIKETLEQVKINKFHKWVKTK